MLEMSQSRQVVVLKPSGGQPDLVMFPPRRADLLGPFKKVLAGAWVFSSGFNTKHSHLPAPQKETAWLFLAQKGNYITTSLV